MTEPQTAAGSGKRSEDPRKAFLRLLAELDDGESAAEWGKDLRELVQAVKDTGNGAEFKLVLKIELRDADDRGHVVIKQKTNVKKPRHGHEPTTFTIGPAGALTPMQPSLDGLN